MKRQHLVSIALFSLTSIALVALPAPANRAPSAAYQPGAISGEDSPVEVKPQILSPLQPIYPAEAMKMWLESSVVVEVILRKDRTVEVVRVVESDFGSKFGFAKSAIEAAQGLKFVPGTKNGQPVDVALKFKIDFKFEEDTRLPIKTLSLRQWPNENPRKGNNAFMLTSTLRKINENKRTTIQVLIDIDQEGKISRWEISPEILSAFPNPKEIIEITRQTLGHVKFSPAVHRDDLTPARAELELPLPSSADLLRSP